MAKLVLDCSAMQSVGNEIQSLSNNMETTANNIMGYSISESDFDFASAKNSIVNNVKGATQKIKNTYKLIEIVIDGHINLQNSLQFVVPNIKTSTSTNVVLPSANKSQSSSGTGIVNTQTSQERANNSTNSTLADQNLFAEKTINIPSGLGKQHTYMGWQMITNQTSNQYKFRETVGMNFDSEGFGKVGDRYVIACTSTFGNVGDLVDFKQSDGTIIKGIIGDIKSQQVTSYDRNPANMWGHNDGQCIVEFVVDKNTWYNSGHVNPGNAECHPEWNDFIISATNYGSYYNLVKSE